MPRDYEPTESEREEMAYYHNRQKCSLPQTETKLVYWIEEYEYALGTTEVWTPIAGPFLSWIAAHRVRAGLSGKSANYRIINTPPNCHPALDTARFLYLLGDQ